MTAGAFKFEPMWCDRRILLVRAVGTFEVDGIEYEPGGGDVHTNLMFNLIEDHIDDGCQACRRAELRGELLVIG